MTCSEIREALSAIADDEPAPLDPVVVRAHLPGCESCRTYQRSLSALGSAAARLRDRTVAPDLAGEVMAQLGRGRTSDTGRSR